MVKSFYDPKVEERGIEKGIERGKIQGKLEGKIETATEMIKDGEPMEKIKKYTKLDEKKILDLMKQIGSEEIQ